MAAPGRRSLLLSVLCCCCFFFFLLACAAVAPTTAVPSQICAGSGLPPVTLGEPLRFCSGHTGISCCDHVDDDQLRDKLDAMDVPDARCAASIKSLLCARCVPGVSSSGFNMAAIKRLIPVICASASSSSSAEDQPMGASITETSSSHQDNSMCLERISAHSFQTMVAHPDGSDRVFLSTLDGKIWEATMPRQGSRRDLRVHLFADLTDRVYHDGVLGLLSMAFHPATNGQFFVSYICDSSRSSLVCGAAAGNRSRPHRYHLVVAEFSAQGGPDSSKATHAAPSEVRRIFTMGLPRAHELYSYQSHVGQILIQPGVSYGYLYLITGHGDFSKDVGSLFGKILRFNVGEGGSSRGTSKPEIYATGLNNPSACSFDSDSPWRLFCADVNDQLSEVVYLVKGGRRYGRSSSNATVSTFINRGRPKEGRMPSIVGGIVYHGFADPWLTGRYLYAYSSRVWTFGRRSPVHVRCSKNSPVPCLGSGIGVGDGSAIGGRVLSLGEDSSKDAFFLTARGLFRVVAPSACSVRAADPQPPPLPPGTGWVLFTLGFAFVFGNGMALMSKATGGLNININILSNFLNGLRFLGNNYDYKRE